eukprot:gb/GFBE01054960.1/.p1 GENE.gb/GFBE01054960.1/~~gb/GFBE01054960.1/.p1  ORF type:complete len:259 (+),score=43.24 gb/GFBE01054960.1/:1-777(+)
MAVVPRPKLPPVVEVIEEECSGSLNLSDDTQEFRSDDRGEVVELTVRALSGEVICKVSAGDHWTVEQVKSAVAPVAKIPGYNQHLLLDLRELFNDEIIGHLPRSEGGMEIALVRRRNAFESDRCFSWSDDYHFLWSDVRYVLPQVQKDGILLRHADAALQADRQVVLAAVSSKGMALRFADGELRADREIVLAAVRNDGRALQHVDELLQHDLEIARAAAQQVQARRPAPQEMELEDGDMLRGGEPFVIRLGGGEGPW